MILWGWAEECCPFNKYSYFVEFGCTKVGDQTDFIKTALTCILDTPRYVPIDMRFDMLVLVGTFTVLIPIFRKKIKLFLLYLNICLCVELGFAD